jgi:hypothetical protein
VTIRNLVLRLAIAPAALIALAATASAPASAQYHRWGPDAPPPPPSFRGDRIHPQHIEEMVRSMGFQPIAQPRPRGPLWVTHAQDRDGRHVRVLIDGYTGRVIDVLRRQGPPRHVSLTPPANIPYSDYPRWQQQPFPPQANAPRSDYEDDDDNDDDDFAYRNQRPQYQPQVPQRGPNVIPYDQRGDTNRAPNAPQTNTAKKKDTKKKNDTTAAVQPDKQKTPAPKARPQEAPKANVTKQDAPKTDTPKVDAPKTAQTPKMPAGDTTRGPDMQATGSVKKNEVPTFDAPKNRPETLPPVQTPF